MKKILIISTNQYFEKYSRLFLDYSNRRGFSNRTAKHYTSSLRKFFAFFKNNKKEIQTLDAITRRDIVDYQNFLYSQKSLSMRTMGFNLYALKTFFKFLVQEEFLLSNPASDIEMPKVGNTLPRNILSESEISLLLNSIYMNSPLNIRDKAIMEVLYSTGIRISECINLQISDILEEEGLIRITQGKGKKDRIIPIGETALKFLKYYILEARPQLMRDEAESDNKIFLNYTGRKFAFSGNMNPILRKHFKNAGIKKKISCHAFRHTCATHMLKGKASIRHVQEQLGHKNLNTTQKYLRMDVTELKKIHAHCHPREKKNL